MTVVSKRGLRLPESPESPASAEFRYIPCGYARSISQDLSFSGILLESIKLVLRLPSSVSGMAESFELRQFVFGFHKSNLRRYCYLVENGTVISGAGSA